MARYRKLDSFADYQRALKNNYGIGEGDDYKPWLRVQDVNSYGNSGKIHSYKSNRIRHTLSENESCFFYLTEFCDPVIDIREQFPLFPLDLSVRIAQELGVNHPVNPRSKDKSLNILTTDFLLTLSDGKKTWYEAVSVKPANELKDNRTAEKLDLERVWWQLQGIPFHLFIMTELNKIQSRNVQWFTTPYRQGSRFQVELMNKAKSMMEKGVFLIEDLCNDFISELNIEHDEALILLKVLLATKQISVDLNKPIAETGILEIVQVPKQPIGQQHAS